jgi:hypothetical protein
MSFIAARREVTVTEAITRRSLTRRILFVTGGFIAFTLLFVIACRIAVLQLFRGIESSRSSGLSSVWNVGSMWADGSFSSAAQTETGKWISRNAERVFTRTPSSTAERTSTRLQLHTKASWNI